MTPAELESLACRTLRCLPEPVAPSALLPQVLAQIERAGRRPWYRRSWRAWPPVWLVATAAVTLAAVQFGIDGLDRVEGHLPPLLGAAGALWRLVIQPNAAYLLGVVCVMAVASAVYCAAISLLLWEGVSKR